MSNKLCLCRAMTTGRMIPSGYMIALPVIFIHIYCMLNTFLFSTWLNYYDSNEILCVCLKAVRIEFFVYIKSCQYSMFYINKMF
jgi:hypothetical protein